MSWDFRVWKVDDGYGIRETYYDENGNVALWTESRIAPYGETPEILKKELLLFLGAFNKPILEETSELNHRADEYVDSITKDLPQVEEI